MAVHSGEDIGMAEVTRKRARRLDAPAVISHCSRLVVDPNRGLDNPTLMPEVSDGTVVPGNRELGAAERRARVDTFFQPSHAAIAAKLDELLAAGRAPALVSLHSFTPVLHGVARPWEGGTPWHPAPPRTPPPTDPTT